VLVVTVLVLLALELLAHGVLVMAARQLAASRADVEMLRARAAARGAVMDLARDVGGASLEGTPAGGGLEGASSGSDGIPVRWRVRRLTREAWMGEAWARVPPTGWELREARLFWRFDPAGRVASFSAVAEAATLRLTDVVGIVRGLDGPEPCDRWTQVLDSLFPLGLPPMARRAVDTATVGPLGPPSWEDVLAAIPVSVGDRGTPEPLDSSGVCLEAPWNWGDVDSEAPCGAVQTWRGARGSVSVEGGVGQGALVARADVELTGTRFRGVVLAGGDLRLRSGASVEGMVRSLGSLEVDASSSLVGSACAALRAMAAAPDALRGLVLRDDIGWLPVR